MGVKFEDRWQSNSFFRRVGPFTLSVEWIGDDGWMWLVHRAPGSEARAKGIRPDEKAAKLAATRAMNRIERALAALEGKR